MSPFSSLQAWLIVVSAVVTALGTTLRVYYDRKRDAREEDRLVRTKTV